MSHLLGKCLLLGCVHVYPNKRSGTKVKECKVTLVQVRGLASMRNWHEARMEVCPRCFDIPMTVGVNQQFDMDSSTSELN